MKTILHTCDIPRAKLGAVYKALTTQKGLAGWWSTQVKADVRVGGTVDFTFHEVFSPDMEITALDENQFVAWKCVGGHDPWLNNTFRFTIEPRGEGCVLFFEQQYAQELSDEEYGRYNYNWGYYLESLRLLVQTGEGKPFRPGS